MSCFSALIRVEGLNMTPPPPPPALQKNQLFVGTFVHSKSLNQLEYLHDASVAVDKSGRIVAIELQCRDQATAAETLCSKLGWDAAADVEVRVCKEGQFFFPGFIGKAGDTHLFRGRRSPPDRRPLTLTRKIHTSMPRNTPMPASSGTRPCWTG